MAAGEQIRRLGVLLRFLGGRGYLQSQGWLPHSGTHHPALFASYWPLQHENTAAVRSAAWTAVLRGAAQNASGFEMSLANVPPPPPGITWHYYDLWAGTELAHPGLPLRRE